MVLIDIIKPLSSVLISAVNESLTKILGNACAMQPPKAYVGFSNAKNKSGKVAVTRLRHAPGN